MGACKEIRIITNANKGDNKCGYACALKHLNCLHTFVLALNLMKAEYYNKLK